MSRSIAMTAPAIAWRATVSREAPRGATSDQLLVLSLLRDAPAAVWTVEGLAARAERSVDAVQTALLDLTWPDELVEADPQEAVTALLRAALRTAPERAMENAVAEVRRLGSVHAYRTAQWARSRVLAGALERGTCKPEQAADALLGCAPVLGGADLELCASPRCPHLALLVALDAGHEAPLCEEHWNAALRSGRQVRAIRFAEGVLTLPTSGEVGPIGCARCGGLYRVPCRGCEGEGRGGCGACAWAGDHPCPQCNPRGGLAGGGPIDVDPTAALDALDACALEAVWAAGRQRLVRDALRVLRYLAAGAREVQRMQLRVLADAVEEAEIDPVEAATLLRTGDLGAPALAARFVEEAQSRIGELGSVALAERPALPSLAVLGHQLSDLDRAQKEALGVLPGGPFPTPPPSAPPAPPAGPEPRTGRPGHDLLIQVRLRNLDDAPRAAALVAELGELACVRGGVVISGTTAFVRLSPASETERDDWQAEALALRSATRGGAQ